MKQTAVEWLIEQLECDDSKIARVIGLKKYNQVVSQAKEMEKQQIIKSRENGISEGYRRTNNFYYDKMVDSDIYYAKTYGSKGSDKTFANSSEKQYLSQINTSQTTKQ